MSPYLHKHQDFSELIKIVSQEIAIAPILVEKDYWIMHCLYSLQKLGLTFQMKGGTSLAKGFKIINRFSEDIDILIEPPEGLLVYTGHNQNSNNQIKSRKNYYDWLADFLDIHGIFDIKQDTHFDDRYYRSGGIRLFYATIQEDLPSDLKEGILLEVGFDDITPTLSQTISSWIYDFALGKTEMIDNRAQNIACYHPGYTLVEKFQTISTKFRKSKKLSHFQKISCGIIMMFFVS